MSLEADIALLKRVPLFADLPTEQLRLIAFSAVRLDLVPGQVLFRAGSRGDCGYLVSSGTIQLANEDGKKQTVACEHGALLGEAALFIETRRPGTATAQTASQVIEIDRKLILRMLSEYPHLAVKMRSILSDRLTATVFELGRVRQALAKIERLPRRG